MITVEHSHAEGTLVHGTTRSDGTNLVFKSIRDGWKFSRNIGADGAWYLPQSRDHNADRTRLKAIPGVVPGAHDRPAACLLHPRCDYALERCRVERPALEGPGGREARCHFPLDAAGRPTGGWRPEDRRSFAESPKTY